LFDDIAQDEKVAFSDRKIKDGSVVGNHLLGCAQPCVFECLAFHDIPFVENSLGLKTKTLLTAQTNLNHLEIAGFRTF
jgi:hypothetical protein